MHGKVCMGAEIISSDLSSIRILKFNNIQIFTCTKFFTCYPNYPITISVCEINNLWAKENLNLVMGRGSRIMDKQPRFHEYAHMNLVMK